MPSRQVCEVFGSIKTEFTTSVTCDGYVPFQIRFLTQRIETGPIGWIRYTDSRHLLEIGVDLQSGMLQDISLVLIPSEWVLYADNRDAAPEIVHGVLPMMEEEARKKCFGTDIFADPGTLKYDIQQGFQLMIMDKYVSLNISHKKEYRVLGDASVGIGLTEAGELSAVYLRDMSAQDREMIQVAIGA